MTITGPYNKYLLLMGIWDAVNPEPRDHGAMIQGSAILD